MLALLLDEHISGSVAEGLRRRRRGLIVRYLAEWRSGSFLGQDDSACLHQAAAEGLTLVTYDCRTIPPLLKGWAEQGVDHGGVVFVDDKTISPGDVGGLVAALAKLADDGGTWNWDNRVIFLRR